jgi:hypothetical protein
MTQSKTSHDEGSSAFGSCMVPTMQKTPAAAFTLDETQPA